MADRYYETERLIARRWRDSDRAAFAALNGDAETMRFFPAPLSRAESDAFIDRIGQRATEDGFCFPAIERKDDGALVGLVGLARIRFDAHFAPAVEIGWRIRRDCWRKGYAAEAAAAALAYGFQELGLEEIVSFTIPANAPSRAVMARLGMTHDPADDFDHPLLPADSPFRRHVLYRIRRADWAPA